MDQFLTLILSLFAFVFFVFFIKRAAKYIILLGAALIVFSILVLAGVVG